MSLPKMKITVPDALKADVPQTKWGKLFAATPIIMTVISTMLASLASSEMTRAQYNRSLGAQLQSKAGDQWSFFQAKRLRGSVQSGTLDVLGATANLTPLTAQRLQAGLALLPTEKAAELTKAYASDTGRLTLEALTNGSLPPLPKQTPISEPMRKAIKLLEQPGMDTELAAALQQVSEGELKEALLNSQGDTQALSAATDPVTNLIEQTNKALATTRTTPEGARLHTDLAAARLAYNTQRYEAEARQNQHVARVYELLVRKSNYIAERHHARSQRFFYGMLAAQIGVIASTFALAARMKNLLWGIAAATGMGALAAAAYVYLYV